VLNFFLRSPGRPISIKTIYEEVWNQQFNPEFHCNNVYVVLSKLRKAWGEHDSPKKYPVLKSCGKGEYMFAPDKEMSWSVLLKNNLSEDLNKNKQSDEIIIETQE
jgi:DNA-binding response OmpR family regulator